MSVVRVDAPAEVLQNLDFALNLLLLHWLQDLDNTLCAAENIYAFEDLFAWAK
jgi:hypothetical protein